MKLAALVAVPSKVVTEIVPVVAPVGTMAVIWVSELTAKLADVPWKATDETELKPVPLIMTRLPTGPVAGEKPVMVGAFEAVTVNGFWLYPVPKGVVTLTLPVVALLGTVAVIDEDELTTKEAAAPLKVTAVAPVKFDPVICTSESAAPLFGATVYRNGAGVVATVKVLFEAVPCGVVMVIAPVVALLGTCACIWVSEITVNIVAVPVPNFTELVPVRCVPVMVM